ncbi:phosphoribosyl-ATP diphosphatase [Hydrogenovibrio sp. JE_KL2]|jgi:phosphoribosyl-ATP pyrophosphohydrolase|uniref:phosphoribosyl-ATP diphosphatase n=1 Tax=Hydrogenovibrio sp. JE_KL2 TaxID=2651188 RepID=UPI00128C111B|nr:phosphoribosyl-ATP diphosphatase [Hydrogenovibrio sp. JE_KL2]MBD3822056.1 phosphoribosyl-ATP diphosphatase [Thiotrichales bacterium]MBN2607347.1 phosphoribosyl-ATP diphosphatase [Thiotrichales bacterium]MPQ76296.1 phosphoribosyl-ATP diphosphatase [Hydrogenovibrio sp. JE_KL2]
MSELLQQLDEVLENRKQESAEDSYVASLYHKGLDKILKKIGEEATETVMAAKDCDNSSDKSHLVYEVTDLWFHSLVLLHQQGLTSQDILQELERRFGLSGHVEKANRSE